MDIDIETLDIGDEDIDKSPSMNNLQAMLPTVSLHLFFAPVRQTGTAVHNNDFASHKARPV